MTRTLGFTGTRRGMTQAQAATVRQHLREYQPHQVHHGDCVGADAELHDLVRVVAPRAWIVVHPPKQPALRAYVFGDEIRHPAPYHTRNERIVAESGLLIATPTGDTARTGGTWWTVRHALGRRRGTVLVVWPDGETESAALIDGEVSLW